METWRSAPDAPGYEVSDHGHVRTVDRVVRAGRGHRTVKGQIIKPYRPEHGYYVVGIWQGGKVRQVRVNRLVLTAFDRPPRPGEVSRHKDNDSSNNHIANLHWGTQADNIRDQVQAGTHRNASKTHCPVGHRYTPENTRVQVRGSTSMRHCKECERDRYRQRADLR